MSNGLIEGPYQWGRSRREALLAPRGTINKVTHGSGWPDRFLLSGNLGIGTERTELEWGWEEIEHTSSPLLIRMSPQFRNVGRKSPFESRPSSRVPSILAIPQNSTD